MTAPRARRVGHGRPVGTLTAPARFSWRGDHEPELGDVTFEVPGPGGDPWELQRAFLLVGVEETASRERPYRLIFERLDWQDALSRYRDAPHWWSWYRHD